MIRKYTNLNIKSSVTMRSDWRVYGDVNIFQVYDVIM